MKTKTILSTLAILLLVLQANATIRYVSQTGAGTFTLPSAAHTAAVAGDTVLIGPGTYSETVGVSITKRLIWIGAGWDVTTINVSGNHWTFANATATGSTFEGIRFNGFSSLPFYNPTTNCDSITARRCLFNGPTNQNAILWNAASGGRLYLEDCVIIQNYQFANAIDGPRSGGVIRNCVIAASVTPGAGNSWAVGYSSAIGGVLEVYNSVFLNWDDIFILPAGSPAAVIINNAGFDFVGTPSWGTIPGSSVIDYNAAPASPGTIGTNFVTIPSNPFVTYDTALNYVIGTTNLNLIGGSNLIDAGNPGINDVNLTRSDIGVYGGPRPLIDGGVPNYPWAVNVTNTPNVVGAGTPVNSTAIGRVGPQ
jgi:hypothetical protein